MRYAVFLKFDQGAQKVLQDLREKLAQNVAGVPSPAGKMAPHLTLAVFDSNNAQEVHERFHIFAKSVNSFTLSLSHLNSFAGRKKVLFVEPQPSPDLQACYERCHAAFSERSAMVPAYQDPTHWHPHITLTKGISGSVFQKAKIFAEMNWTPLKATAQLIGLINVQKPLEILASHVVQPYSAGQSLLY